MTSCGWPCTPARRNGVRMLAEVPRGGQAAVLVSISTRRVDSRSGLRYKNPSGRRRHVSSRPSCESRQCPHPGTTGVRRPRRVEREPPLARIVEERSTHERSSPHGPPRCLGAHNAARPVPDRARHRSRRAGASARSLAGATARAPCRRRGDPQAAEPRAGELRRRQRARAPDGRARRLRAGPRLRARDLRAAQEPARARLDAGDLGADLRDLQDVPDQPGQVPPDPRGRSSASSWPSTSACSSTSRRSRS